jgi:DNA-binding GntR family transcriptional regulator
MALQPAPRAVLGQSVADIIRNAILGGSLKPGEPLYENMLARQLSVSRSPIREALIQLERESLVVSRINKPAEVRRPSADEIRQTYTIRSSLEGIAARWAADNMTPALVTDLSRRADALNKATIAGQASAGTDLVAMALDFHNAIAEATGSEELTRLLRSLCNQIRFVMSAGLASLSDRRAEAVHEEHLAIITAISAKDGDRAERLAIAHVREARDRLIGLSDGGP